jgi:hypothetical protein
MPMRGDTPLNPRLVLPGSPRISFCWISIPGLTMSPPGNPRLLGSGPGISQFGGEERGTGGFQRVLTNIIVATCQLLPTYSATPALGSSATIGIRPIVARSDARHDGRHSVARSHDDTYWLLVSGAAL